MLLTPINKNHENQENNGNHKSETTTIIIRGITIIREIIIMMTRR